MLTDCVAASCQGHAAGLQGGLHGLLGVGVVVDHGGQGDPVAHDEEARRHRAHQQRQGGDHVGGALADQRIGGQAARIHAPGGQVVRQGDGHRGLSARVGDDARCPQRRLLEVLADGHLLQRAPFSGHVSGSQGHFGGGGGHGGGGEGHLGFALGLLFDQFVAEHVEQGAQGHVGVDVVLLRAVELLLQRDAVGRHQREDGQVGHDHAHFGADGFAARIYRLDRQRDGLAGAGARRRRRDGDLQATVHRLHGQRQCASAVGGVGRFGIRPLDQHHRQVNGGHVFFGDGQAVDQR
ncbi:MAG: hypothetical protein KatS3mg051_1210 [Anaerolineae bacterium]|nr:MAG: hypothetical protein KatS3mg051_1210 [Anaerolineae bacterium]